MELENEINGQVSQYAVEQHYEQITKKKNSKKRIIVGLSITAVLVVGLLFGLFFGLNKGKSKTELLALYEQLGDQMTYDELINKMNEIAPSANIFHDEGVYVIMIGEDESENITFSEELNETDATDVDDADADNDDDTDKNDDNENSAIYELEDDEEFLDAFVKEILAEGDLEDENDEDVDIEEEYSDSVSSGGNSEIAPTAIVSNFSYSFFKEYEVNDETKVVNIYIEKIDDGYEVFDDEESVVLPTKTQAVDRAFELM